MIHETALVRELVAPVWCPPPASEECVNRIEILRVLERAAVDNSFIAELTDRGSRALEGYTLSQQEKAALVSGDLAWLETHLGKLSHRLRTWPECRLQQERW